MAHIATKFHTEFNYKSINTNVRLIDALFFTVSSSEINLGSLRLTNCKLPFLFTGFINYLSC